MSAREFGEMTLQDDVIGHYFARSAFVSALDAPPARMSKIDFLSDVIKVKVVV